MRNSEAQRYSRFAAAAAIAITLIAGGFYGRRAWLAKQAARNAPPPVPTSIEKTSQGFSLSRGTGDRTFFTVRASHATQFKAGNRAVLLDVWITVYGPTGARLDNIRTRSCDYDQAGGKFTCAGDVQLDFQSAANAQQVANGKSGQPVSPNIVHAQTRGLSFNRDSGDAWTDQPVALTFPGGNGTATGVNYTSGDGVINLLHDVRFHLQSAMPRLAGSKSAKTARDANPNSALNSSAPVDIAGSSVEFQRDTGIIFMRGPVVAMQSPPSSHRELHASELRVELDTEMRARQITARGTANAASELFSKTPKGEVRIAADNLSANFAPAGWMKNFHAAGHVHSSTKSSTGHDEIAAEHLDADMVPELNLPAKAHGDGAVKIDSSRAGTSRHFESADIDATFENVASTIRGGKTVSHLRHAETTSPASVSWQQPPKQKSKTATAQNAPQNGTPALDKMLLTGQRLQMDFTDDSRLKNLQVHGAAKVDRTDATGTKQTSTSDELAAHLGDNGEWSEVLQDGHVRMHDELHAAQGEHARVDRATNILKITGAAQISDDDSRTNADAVELNQTTKEIHADGHVITTYLKNASAAGAAAGNKSQPQKAAATISLGSTQPGQPTHASSEHLVANSDSGKATYTGHARLWQGDTTIEGDTVALDRAAKQIDAQGSVHATFLEQPKPAAESAAPQKSSKKSQPQLWKVRAAQMTYSDPKSIAHLEGGFTADSQDFSIAGQTGDLYFTPNGAPSQSASNGKSGGGQSLDHAIASGEVAVRQGDRHGTAERGEYTAADGKFTLSGGNPTFYDAAGNTTTGRQLTFFTADDTILVQSETTSLPLPRHRVEK